MTENDGYFLIALIVLPLLSAAGLMVIPSKERAVIVGLTAISSLIMFIVSVYVFMAYSFDGSTFQGVMSYPWVENIGLLGENGISLKVGIDGVTASLVLLTGIVVLPGTWVSWKIQHRLKDFFILFYILTAGVYGVFVLLDLFFWFLAYETALLPMYLLIAVWGSTRKEYGAMKLMMMLMAGSIPLFAAFAYYSIAFLSDCFTPKPSSYL